MGSKVLSTAHPISSLRQAGEERNEFSYLNRKHDVVQHVAFNIYTTCMHQNTKVWEE